MNLGILDYAIIDENQGAHEALWNTTHLAKHAEELGYKRFWVAEHHKDIASASNNPEMLMMHLAAHTKSIRVGSGGVMLPNYSSYKVAENFKMMEALYPNRIDLGVGRATGADHQVTFALNDEKRGNLPFETKVQDLKGFVSGEFPVGNRYHGNIYASPQIDTLPEFFILGGSGSTSSLAASEGLGFTFAHFINPSGSGKEATAHYLKNFKPSKVHQKPYVIVAVFAVIAETDSIAEDLARSLDHWLLKDGAGEPVQFLFPESLDNYKYREDEKMKITQNRTRAVVGSPQTVKAQLDALQKLYNADEMMILPAVPGLENRKKSISLLIKEYK
ncbi:LLM class flavin-dependent oxidoreductase [Neobacillus mesonae]|nr:LLM class flavin-dependent oxidoreductase [Neobacillus mesonae]